MKVWAFNVVLCVDERFYICTVCIKVLLAICQRIYGSKLQPQIRKSWDSMENANKKRK